MPGYLVCTLLSLLRPLGTDDIPQLAHRPVIVNGGAIPVTATRRNRPPVTPIGHHGVRAEIGAVAIPIV